MNDLVNWKKPENSIGLLKNETHIWCLPLNLNKSELDKVKSLLIIDEKERAGRFHFDKHRNHYIAARGQMRRILSLYLNKDSESINFSYNEFGKPFLENKSLYFNISHSHKLALLAVNLIFDLGVDIEWMHRKTNLLEIGERFFSPNEYNELTSLPEELQQQGFFNCWTRKESYIKARGKGLGIPLSKFEVSLIPDEYPLLKSTAHDPEAINNWKLHAFNPHPEYAAGLTINTDYTRLKFWNGSDLF